MGPLRTIGAFSVIVTVASVRSLRGRTSDSFAERSRYRFLVSASNPIVILTEPSYAERKDSAPPCFRFPFDVS